MIPFREFLLELFDKPYPIEWEKRNNSFWRGKFYTKDDIIKIYFSLDIEKYWEITFASMSGENAYALSKLGDEIAVFSTIIAATKEFISKINPPEIRFSADKSNSPTRGRLYERLLKRFAAQHGYRFSVIEKRDHHSFILIRNDLR